MIKVVKVVEDVVNDIQAKDIEATTAQEVIMQILDMHKLDEDSSFMQSPVFKTYEKSAVEKRIAFEKAKDKMASEYVPAGVKNWNLNYFTCDLTLTYADD